MKASNEFQAVIQRHLEELAQKDPLFAETIKKPKKNIGDCITYILNTVQASGCNGFADEEVFAMAVHYYDEDDINPGKAVNGKVIVNHTVAPEPKPEPVELTEEDKKLAKQQAMERAINEEKEKLKKKPAKKTDSQSQTASLFD